MENSTITFITDQMKALTSIPSPSGFTKEVAQYLVSTLEEMGFTPERSRKGNVCVTIGGEGSPLVPWCVPSRATAACVRRHWADISGARLTVKTAPYIQEMEKYTQVSY